MSQAIRQINQSSSTLFEGSQPKKASFTKAEHDALTLNRLRADHADADNRLIAILGKDGNKHRTPQQDTEAMTLKAIKLRLKEQIAILERELGLPTSA